MKDKKDNRRDGQSIEALAMARLEALEPEEGRMGEPGEKEVRFIFLPPWTGDYEEPPRVIKHPEGYTLVIHGREIPEEYAEEYLWQHPEGKVRGEEEGG